MKSKVKSPKVNDIQKAVGERVKARLPSVLFDALVKQHERHGFKTGCTCKYCKEKRIVSHWYGYGDQLNLFRNKARSRLREVSEKELDDFTGVEKEKADGDIS